MHLVRRTHPLTAVLLLALVSPACRPAAHDDGPTPPSGSGAAPSTALEGTEWTLATLDAAPAAGGIGGARPTLRLDAAAGRAGGNTGCNSYSGPYTRAGDSLRFGPLVSTRRACLEETLNTQERDFLAALEGTRRWSLAGDTLTLAGAAGALAGFVAR